MLTRKNLITTFSFLFLLLFLMACNDHSMERGILIPSSNQATLAVLVESLKTEVALTGTPTNQNDLTYLTPSVTTSPPTTTPIPNLTSTPTPDVRPNPDRWSEWPVIPTVSWTTKQIYLYGIRSGNQANAFSTVGDCQSEPNVFMGIYETNRYWLGDNYQFLQETINFYKGSFSRKSLAVRDGLSAPTALSSLWTDPEFCNSNETPVSCEMRVYKPSIVFINLGTNWKPGASSRRYEQYLRQIVDIIIQNGGVPILSTKADNVEGDNSINLVTARVAHDYDIPLWNFWLAAQSLPNHGLDQSRNNIYLTPDGWDRRNFTGLEVLDALHRALLVSHP